MPHNNQGNDDDQKILDYLERSDPNEFDEFMGIVEKVIAKSLPRLTRKINSYGSNFDADDVLSKGLERAIKWLMDQFMGKDTPFQFSRSYRLQTLDDWILHVIGKPGAGPGSGTFGPAIKGFKKRCETDVSIEANPGLIEEQSYTDDSDEDNNVIENAVLALPARQQFVIRLTFDLHSYPVLTADTIAKLAEEMANHSATPESVFCNEVSKIRRRAKALRLDDSLRQCVLTQKDIGTLLDISDRQVRNLKEDALEALRKNWDADSLPQMMLGIKAA